MGAKQKMGEHMRVGISGEDDFVQPYLEAALGDSLIRIPSEILQEKMQVDAMLASCDAVVLMLSLIHI